MFRRTGLHIEEQWSSSWRCWCVPRWERSGRRRVARDAVPLLQSHAARLFVDWRVLTSFTFTDDAQDQSFQGANVAEDLREQRQFLTVSIWECVSESFTFAFWWINQYVLMRPIGEPFWWMNYVLIVLIHGVRRGVRLVVQYHLPGNPHQGFTISKLTPVTKSCWLVHFGTQW